jgi:metal-responsive CopG/Arc/MetJ family transcriptional regulator
MTTITVTIPDFLHAEVDQLVKREGMSWDQFVALAVAEKTAAIATEGYLEERARRGSKEKFLAAMAKVADVEPLDERDRWISTEAHHLTAVLAESKVPYEAQESELNSDSGDEEMV